MAGMTRLVGVLVGVSSHNPKGRGWIPAQGTWLGLVLVGT